MRSNKLFIISIAVIIISLIIMLINFQFYAFSDWIVRIDGIIILISLATVTYNTIKTRAAK